MGRHYRIKSMNIEFELPDKTEKVYIVGADTYSGSHFAKYWLENGNEVYGCGRSKKLSRSIS